MGRLLPIDTCKDCKFLKLYRYDRSYTQVDIDSRNTLLVCGKAEKIIKKEYCPDSCAVFKLDYIPEWCPLDAKE